MYKAISDFYCINEVFVDNAPSTLFCFILKTTGGNMAFSFTGQAWVYITANILVAENIPFSLVYPNSPVGLHTEVSTKGGQSKHPLYSFI